MDSHPARYIDSPAAVKVRMIGRIVKEAFNVFKVLVFKLHQKEQRQLSLIGNQERHLEMKIEVDPTCLLD